jgi:hypothetical protein
MRGGVILRSRNLWVSQSATTHCLALVNRRASCLGSVAGAAGKIA